jgi:hypothetical protein
MFLEPEDESLKGSIPKLCGSFQPCSDAPPYVSYLQKLDMCGFGFWGKKHESLH